jgi:phosphoserine phosphatase
MTEAKNAKNLPVRKGVPALLVAGNWEQCWRDTLTTIGARGINKLHLTDFDGTKYEDVLVQANEALGPVDPVTGGKRWRIYDAAFKNADGVRVPNGLVLPDRAILRGDRMYMSNGAHLDAEYRDLMAAMRKLHADADPLEKLIEWVCANIPLIPGAASFVDSLTQNGIASVGITNGAYQIAEALLVHNGLDVPFMGNYFQDGGFRCVHGDDVGVDKARLVEIAHEMGFRVVSCAGDSKGDIGLSTATAKVGGLVIVRGSEGGLAAWARENLQDNQWVLVEDYVGNEALSAVLQRIGEPAAV